MAWNRSSNGQQTEPALRRGGTPRTTIVRGVIAGVVVLLGSGIAAWWLWPTQERGENVASAQKGLIKEAVPAKAATTPVIVTNAPMRKSNLDYARLAAEGRAVVTNPAGKEIVLCPGALKPRQKARYAIFNHEAENKIAALISAEPGTRFFGTPKYDDKFRKDFLKSCEEPIIIGENDSEYERQLKKSMTEVKIELKNRMSDGEDICKIMDDTRKELQRMGIVRTEVQQMIREQAKSAHGEDDIDDIITAANRILESKGIAPVKMNPVLRQSLIRSATRKRPVGKSPVSENSTMEEVE